MYYTYVQIQIYIYIKWEDKLKYIIHGKSFKYWNQTFYDVTLKFYKRIFSITLDTIQQSSNKCLQNTLFIYINI